MNALGQIHTLLAFAALLFGGLVVLSTKGTKRHRLLGWSYIGLLAAAVSEITTRLINFPFGWTVAISSVPVILVGGVIVRKRVPAVVARLRLPSI